MKLDNIVHQIAFFYIVRDRKLLAGVYESMGNFKRKNFDV